MMQSVVRSTLIALALLSGVASAAGDRLRYKWRDEGGNLHYSDSVPPQATRLGYEVVNEHGVVVRRVERAKTEEELAAAKAAADKIAAEKRRADEAARNDAQMLAAYPTEDDLRKSLQGQIDLITQNIQATEVGIASQEKSLAERLVHAAEQERNGKPVPAAVQKQINTLRSGLAEQKAFLERRTADRAAMEKQLVSDIEHYRQIKKSNDEQRGAKR
ncbi:MAG TPA: DUF4124 domain-containing protein [Tahibacter sp.]|uniref:DUF4124 domain-containing protein n=1 Tax=Tahibacter sp. TaxID=2056211 RepID=UPI002BFAB12B|nr:DUF4124 domain-containing protein [Tahibacter sp.]HSX61046.1 DUF4124 domain-containing protein [Tahibacter sp.]